MKLSEMPLAAFDIESTGVEVTRDRIVTATIITIDGAQVHADEWLLDPGIDIPDGAAKIHGITTERARADGQDYAEGYAQIRSRLETVWAQGHALVIMNAAYDLSLLHWEGRRLEAPELVVGAVIDPLVIDKQIDRFRKGKRTLTALCEHYGVPQGQAHDATGDCLSAARVAWKLLRRPELASFGDIDSLMAAQAQWKAEQAESLHTYFKRTGNDESAATVDGEWPVRRTA